jgi:endonuclease III
MAAKAPRRKKWTGEELQWLLAELRRARETAKPTTLAEVERARDPFRLLVACVISLRTKDAVTAASSARLFARAATPSELAALTEAEIASLIYPAGFSTTKSKQLRAIAASIAARPGARVPADMDALLALPGVGRKTANLVLGLGFGVPAICVDTHVHRVSNRLGLVATKTPAETERALEGVLPQSEWIDINDLLVTFGQTVCHPTSPRCSTCPLAARCERRGVTHHR